MSENINRHDSYKEFDNKGNMILQKKSLSNYTLSI